MKAYESLKETLSFYGVNSNEPYYISSGNPIFDFHKKPFRMDFYAFCICISGTIELEIDSHSYKIGVNDFLISAPSTIVHFVRHSEDFRMRILFFDKAFLLKNISHPFFIEKLGLFNDAGFQVNASSPEQSKRLFNLLNYLYEQTDRKDRFIKDIIRTIIINILLEISLVIDTHPKTSVSLNSGETKTIYHKFIQLVQQNIATHQDVQFYADHLFVNSKYLIKVVKQNSGKTPGIIIDEHLLKLVYVLLGNPEKTISQIAFEVGFSSTSSFGRFFKKKVSISPQEYRKNLSR